MRKGVNPSTIRETVEKWDNGGTLWSVEMGGLGPGYEQCIQILVMEILRDFVDAPTPAKGATDEAWEQYFGDAFAEEAVARCEDSVRGFSGAQVGAAKNLAAGVIRLGWDSVFEEAGDRCIQVDNFWPKPPEVS